MFTSSTKIVLHFLILIKFNNIQILNTVPKKLYVKFYQYIKALVFEDAKKKTYFVSLNTTLSIYQFILQLTIHFSFYLYIQSNKII